MRNRKKQNLRFIIVLVLMCLGIGYAYLNTTLSINGTTDIDSNSWNIYWDNVQVADGSVTGEQVTQAPTIDSSLTSVSFHVRLKEPGEFYEFTVDAVNDGTLDAMIETVTKTTNIPNYFKYDVTYNSGAPLVEKQQLNANSTETYNVRVEYRTDIDPSDLPSTPQSLDLSLEVAYVQADDNAIVVPNASFKISCEKEKLYGTSGMTIAEWLKSDYYKGNISGIFYSLEGCQNLWGNNRGCAFVRSQQNYYYTYTYTYLTLDHNKCELDGNTICNTLYNSVYKNNDNNNLYRSLETCTNYANNGCSLVPIAYETGYSYDWYFEDASECALAAGHTCSPIVLDYYSPTYREGSLEGEFRFYPDSDYIVYTVAWFAADIDINDVIDNQMYYCETPGECVSPESNILSGNGKTIKAKDIKENDLIVYYNFDINRTEIGRVSKVLIHKDATSLIRYEFEDNTYLEATDYHPIYTKEGWKSYTNRNGYPKPVIGDLVKTNTGYKRITKIVPYSGKEDYYDFQVISKDGKQVNNYYANGTLVQGSY